MITAQLQTKVKAFKSGKMIVDTTKRKKGKGRALLSKLEELNPDKIYIRITYKNGFYNDGDYTSMKDVIRAWIQWTEKPLMEYIRGR